MLTDITKNDVIKCFKCIEKSYSYYNISSYNSSIVPVQSVDVQCRKNNIPKIITHVINETHTFINTIFSFCDEYSNYITFINTTTYQIVDIIVYEHTNCSCMRDKDSGLYTNYTFHVNKETGSITQLIPPVDLTRQDAIKAEFIHAYNGYKLHAFGHDELKPISQKFNNDYNSALTLIDSLDSLLIMNLIDEYKNARQWIAKNLSFNHQRGVSVFEMTIRVLGGLLSAYALTGDELYKAKAVELADGIMEVSFDTITGIPFGTIDLIHPRRAYNFEWANYHSCTVEAASIQLEFQYLSRITGNVTYANKVNKVIKHLEGLNVTLYTQWISPLSGLLTSSVVTFGARVDSLYEYLLKSFILHRGEKYSYAKVMYDESMEAMKTILLRKSVPSNLTYLIELHGSEEKGKFDHLACFTPGMLALGYYYEKKWCGNENDGILNIAKELMSTCIDFYTRSPTGLAPEIVQFVDNDNIDYIIDPNAQHNLLRPETVESLFYLYRITKNDEYKQIGWRIFKSFRKYCRVDGEGYAGLKSVRNNRYPNRSKRWFQCWNNHMDKMESFFLSETLKYLYLLFTDHNEFSIDEWVFNTEAHMFPIESTNSQLFK